jgi:hypothetical protein
MVIAVASVVLLLFGYLGSVVSTTFASSAGWVPNSVRSSDAFFWYIMPGCWYASLSGWPGSSAYKSWLEGSMQAGQSVRGQG